MSSPIFLHIGMPKTGTSSIQAYLHENREALRRQGLVVPLAPGRKNHSKITLYAHAYKSRVTIRRAHDLVGLSKVKQFRDTFRAELKEEASRWSRDEAVVFTGEHMSLLHEPEEFERLKELLSVMGKRPVRIVVYLRRQDLFYLSGYSQRIKNGSTQPWSELGENFDPSIYDYAALLEGWKTAFGKESIVVRVFERPQMIGGDLIKDFMSVIGLKDAPLSETVRKNESLDYRSLEFLRRLNPWYPRFVNGQLNKHRRALVSAMEQLSVGPSLRMGRAEALAFLAQYEDSNSRVAREYLGRSDGRLFLDDPKDEPEQAPSLSLDDVIEMSSKLWAIANKIESTSQAESREVPGSSPQNEEPSPEKDKGSKRERTQAWSWF